MARQNERKQREQQTTAKTKRVWPKIRSLVMFLVSFCIVFGICFGVYRFVNKEFFSIEEVENPKEITVEIKSGWGTSRIAAALYGDNPDNQLIRSKALFKVYVDFVGKGKKLRAGTYTFQQGDSLAKIVSKIAGGDSVQAKALKFTLTEGMTVEDMAYRLRADDIIDGVDEFLALCRSGQGFEELDIPPQSANKPRNYFLEGYLFPDTYEVYEGTDVNSVIKMLVMQFHTVMEASYYERMEELEMTQFDIITMASIIEKEAQTDDFKKVSAVLHNRLAADMYLQSDATIRYELDVSTINLTKQQLEKDSSYNTHTNKGLPAGPICNPGKAAIEAALYPDQEMIEEQYLYFTLKEPESGQLAFTKTLEEHNEQVEKYRVLWEEYDRNRANENPTETGETNTNEATPSGAVE